MRVVERYGKGEGGGGDLVLSAQSESFITVQRVAHSINMATKEICTLFHFLVLQTAKSILLVLKKDDPTWCSKCRHIHFVFCRFRFAINLVVCEEKNHRQVNVNGCMGEEGSQRGRKKVYNATARA